MIFYGNGIVWDKQKNKKLCLFKNGHLETEDSYIIETLLASGYEHETIVKAPVAGYEEMTVADLREIAKDREIPGYTRKNKSQLIKILKEGN